MGDQNSDAQMSLNDIVANIDAAVDQAALPANSDSQMELDLQPQVEEAEQDVPDSQDTAEQEPNTDEQASDQEEVQAEISEGEQAARDKGWRPKEEWTGAEGQWVDHDEFNRRTELFDKIGSQNKTIKALNKKLDALINHNQTLEKNTREKVLAELEAKRREAVSYGDTEAFDAAETRIKELQNQESALKVDETETETVPDQPEIPQPIKDFAQRNGTWFEKDKEMTEFAVFKVQQLTNGGVAIDEALTQAEEAVKTTFAAKFAPKPNPRKTKPSAVMSGQTEARPTGGKQFSDLTPEQKQVWHTLKGHMSLEQFLKQIGD